MHPESIPSDRESFLTLTDPSGTARSDTPADPRWLPDPVVAALAEADAPWPCIAAGAADAKLGTATLVLDVGDALAVTDHFVITNGNNGRQVKAIVDEVEHQVKLVNGPAPRSVEGLESLDWVLMDYGAFVVHVFSADARGYYQLERLWKDCEQVDWRSLVPAHLQPRVGGDADSAAVDAGDGEADAGPVDATVDPIVERATW